MSIGGNVTARLQQKSDKLVNEIGERITEWSDYLSLYGWLDLSNVDSKYTYDVKLQESTHIFICDYVDMNRNANDKRLIVNGLAYDVLLIDNPMEMNYQLEIYLKYIG